MKTYPEPTEPGWYWAKLYCTNEIVKVLKIAHNLRVKTIGKEGCLFLNNLPGFLNDCQNQVGE